MILQLDGLVVLPIPNFRMFVYSYQNNVLLLSKSNGFGSLASFGVFNHMLELWFKNDYAIKASAIRKEMCHCETCPDFALVAQPRRILPLFCF